MPIIGVIASSAKGAPAAPVSVSATDVGTSRAYNNGAATVSFTPGAGATATSFTATSSPGGFTATGASSPLTVAGLQSGVAYTFTVTATNAAGTSPASSASNSITATTVPQAPTVSAADVGTGRAYNNGAATVTVSGGATGGKTISSYTATSSPGSFTATSGSPITVTGLASATAYTFSVTATNANGTSTATVSNSITATTVPQAPTIGTATAGNAQATVTFTSNATGGSAITGFTATSSPSSITGTNSASPITVTGLTNNTAYTFTVTATNANGTSTASAASNSVTPVSPYWIEYGTMPGNPQMRGLTILPAGGVTLGFLSNPQYGYVSVDGTGAITAQSRGLFAGTNPSAFINAVVHDFTSSPNYIYAFGIFEDGAAGDFGYSVFFNGTWATPQINTGGGYGQFLAAKKQPSSANVIAVGRKRDPATGYTYLQTARFNANTPASASYYIATNNTTNNFYDVDVSTSSNFVAGGQVNTGGMIVSQMTAGGVVAWAKIITNPGYWPYGVACYSDSLNYVSISLLTGSSLHLIAWNPTNGAIAWQRSVTGLNSGVNEESSKVCMDSTGAAYFMMRQAGSACDLIIVKYNNTGTRQWQRRIQITNAPNVDWRSITTDGTNIYMSNSASNTDILRYPCDGSVTGTYSYRGGSMTITASSFGEGTPTSTAADVTLTRTGNNAYGGINSVSTGTPTYAITQKTTL